MSEYKQFIIEKNKIDSLIEQGFQFSHVMEGLDGTFIDFYKLDRTGKKIIRRLHLQMAESRKYMASLLFIKDRKNQ